MEIYFSPHFERQFKKLEAVLKKEANKKIDLFRNNPFDPKLKTHKLHGALKELWSFSVDYRCRIVFKIGDKNVAKFYSIDDHDIYD